VNRRRFLKRSALASIGGLLRLPSLTPTAPTADNAPLDLTGDIREVHDPAIIKQGDTYYLYSTGPGIHIRYSTNLREWKRFRQWYVFLLSPDWTRQYAPGATDIWAPDIAFFNGKYHLYYSVSVFGYNLSCIGLATNTTLDPGHKDYNWVDEGLVVATNTKNDYNAIDPNLILDADGAPWLTFGSFWSGIKLRRLDSKTGKPSEGDTTLYALARRSVSDGSVEAPFIIYRDQWYYLFVSFDFCCRGQDSTYRVMVGRAEKITGPYTDRAGVEMLKGGGTQVTFPTDQWRGPGHCAILREPDTDYLVYHAYDAQKNGLPTLRIQPMTWDAEGWPAL
jgi:arabinan endo-1,5-alpha-L-arabinosidase